MKKIVTISAIITIILILATSGILVSLPMQPPKAKTGAPGEGTCSDCHTGAGLNQGPGYVSLSFSGAGNKYKLGKNYTVTVTVVDTSEMRYAFETVSLDESNNMAGKVALLDTANTSTQNSHVTGRRYVNDKYATSLNTWTYQWKSPSSSIGPITFYGAGNAANGNDLTTGDNVYTTNMVIAPFSGVNKSASFENVNDSPLSVYPNPVRGNDFTVSFSVEEDGMVSIDLLDMNGRYIEPLFHAAKEAGNQEEKLHMHRVINQGVYLVAVKAGEKIQFQKVLIGM